MILGPCPNGADHTTHHKRKVPSIIKCTSQFQQSNLHNLQRIKDRFDEGYDSDGEPVPFFDMEYLEDNQYFDEDALPDVFPLGTGENYSNDEGN